MSRDTAILELELSTDDGLTITGSITVTDTEGTAETVARDFIDFFNNYMNENTPDDSESTTTVERKVVDINEYRQQKVG